MSGTNTRTSRARKAAVPAQPVPPTPEAEVPEMITAIFVTDRNTTNFRRVVLVETDAELMADQTFYLGKKLVKAWGDADAYEITVRPIHNR